MSALLTIQQTEFMTFALDCGLQTGEFGSARIGGLFTRADQVDDTLKATKVKTLGINKNAKAGDGSDKANPNSLSRAADRIQEVEITVMKNAIPGVRSLFVEKGNDRSFLNGFIEINPAMHDFDFDGVDDTWQRKHFRFRRGSIPSRSGP